MTNKEWIRSMNDDELASFLLDVAKTGEDYIFKGFCEKCSETDKPCKCDSVTEVTGCPYSDEYICKLWLDKIKL